MIAIENSSYIIFCTQFVTFIKGWVMFTLFVMKFYSFFRNPWKYVYVLQSANTVRKYIFQRSTFIPIQISVCKKWIVICKFTIEGKHHLFLSEWVLLNLYHLLCAHEVVFIIEGKLPVYNYVQWIYHIETANESLGVVLVYTTNIKCETIKFVSPCILKRLVVVVFFVTCYKLQKLCKWI